MKVLQVIPSLEAGGAEGFVTNLGVSLAEQGAEVRFFLMAGARGERGRVLLQRLLDAGCEVHGVEEHNVRSPMNILQLARLIRSWRPEIVQANMYTAEVLVAIAKTLASGSGACYVRRLANTEQVGYRSATIVRMMDRFFRQTIACSPAVAVAYEAFMGSNHKSQLATISNGGLLQDAVTTQEERREAREALGVPKDAFTIAHIGRMFGGDRADSSLAEGQKAHDVLLESFAGAFVGDAACRLILVGDGPLRSEAEALAARLEIADQTHFLGQQPEPWPALKAADVFCFPSRYEGLPNVMPEAASCGLPVVASDIPEIYNISRGDSWALKPVNDVDAFAEGLRAVRENPEHYAALGRDAAPGFREEFSMRACARKYLDAYEQALALTGSGS
jgi:glycosyltransferase involved in cell wall biosynthesis